MYNLFGAIFVVWDSGTFSCAIVVSTLGLGFCNLGTWKISRGAARRRREQTGATQGGEEDDVRAHVVILILLLSILLSFQIHQALTNCVFDPTVVPTPFVVICFGGHPDWSRLAPGPHLSTRW